jgi:prepilin-type N-terminal cleavage/methylation domain-containing protein
MQRKLNLHDERGFSLIELMIVVGVMVIISAAVVQLMKGSMNISSANYELTDAQQNLRTSQEYINRDLMNAGDGLRGISEIRVGNNFITNYLTLTPLDNATATVDSKDLAIVTSDNQVPVGTVVVGASPATTVRGTTDADRTDRQNILEVDPQFIALTPTAIDSTGTLVTLPTGTDMTQFTANEIYFFSSANGGTFATITAVNAGARQLSFATGATDPYGLNLSGTSNNIKYIATSSTGSALATAMTRMRIIHYYVNASGYLMRRVFGAKCLPAPATCQGFMESVVAEHVVNVQFKYSLDMTDADGNVVQPVNNLSSKAERLAIRQVEATVTVETPHVLPSGDRGNLAMVTSTSVRNLQFRRAQQPTAVPSP